MSSRPIRLALEVIGALAVVAAVLGAIAFVQLGHWLQYADAPAKADYIVPLSGDDHRILKAAELYKQDFAPAILLSNAATGTPSRVDDILAQLGQPRRAPYATRKLLLDHLGVPAAATAEFGNGHVSTVDEAEALRGFLGNRNVTIILVTSPYHARRAKLTFERVLPNDRFLIVSPPEGRLHDPWWSDRTSALLAVNEAAKLLHFWIGGAFRARPAA